MERLLMILLQPLRIDLYCSSLSNASSNPVPNNKKNETKAPPAAPSSEMPIDSPQKEKPTHDENTISIPISTENQTSSDDSNIIEFTEYFPFVFHYIRSIYNIKDSDYINELKQVLDFPSIFINYSFLMKFIVKELLDLSFSIQRITFIL